MVDADQKIVVAPIQNQTVPILQRRVSSRRGQPRACPRRRNRGHTVDRRPETVRRNAPQGDFMNADVARDIPNRHYLTPLFEPASVAIVGASETSGKVGATL